MARAVPLTATQRLLLAPWTNEVEDLHVVLSGWGVMASVALRVSAVTLNGVVYMRPECFEDTVQGASLIRHEAEHVRHQRELGWWRYLAQYVTRWMRAPRADPRTHPMEIEAYRKGDEVIAWHAAR